MIENVARRSYAMSTPQRPQVEIEPAQEIVALVPGFLGFDRLGGFAYFADHIGATLRAALEITQRSRSPVIPLNTPPAGSLAARQHALIEQLGYWVNRYQARRVHLVTHSAGGVDAYFLTGATTLEGTPWSDAQRKLRERIVSIVTMGAPFLGTRLSNSELARFVGGASRLPPSLCEVVGLGTGLVHLLLENRALLERLGAFAAGLPAAGGLVRQLLRHRELLGDLSPKRMCERYERFNRDIEPMLTCFASYVPPPDPSTSSPLFRQLYGYTAAGADDDTAGRDLLDVNRRLLTSGRVLCGGASGCVELGPESSDGIVNSLRQLPPGIKESEVGGLIVADHADLLGYFDRIDHASGTQQQISIFRSGAVFRDDQFFALFGRVADRLIQA